MTDNTQELDDILYTLAEKSADSDSSLGYAEAYEFAQEAKQAILEWAAGAVGEDEGLVEVTKRNLVTASHFNAVIKSRNQLREIIRNKLKESI